MEVADVDSDVSTNVNHERGFAVEGSSDLGCDWVVFVPWLATIHALQHHGGVKCDGLFWLGLQPIIVLKFGVHGILEWAIVGILWILVLSFLEIFWNLDENFIGSDTFSLG